ncbi:MAG: hypothetical protein WCK65_06860 [Rhodospirillaceae bacterium]
MRAPVAIRRRVPVFHPMSPAQAVLMARVKDGFDPGRILNRSRMYDLV